ncbi:uncharacterized protein BT62DRAFT_1006150 [Guyanagaster necrorhizus]|uniref:Uncharacterized protein n=1 Tax=Guyanagaster necrorhizus TaxID=856835 RepID=A0A9P7VR82_9AGAR|nr:uncharacterized protein BT62DRAFT_1006150 [Guyanagaster necrorhizus MCA 3950]KAG7445966.1 hypothetical protein BT62DRAFT_1006150 [Guyanagaster necrorhizus MCA 3950]
MTDQAPNVVQNDITDTRNSPRSEGRAMENITNPLDFPSWDTLHVASSEPSDNGLHLPGEDGGDELDTDGSADSEFFREQERPQIDETTILVDSERDSSSEFFTEPDSSATLSKPPELASVSRVPKSPSKFIGVVIPKSGHSTPNRYTPHAPSTTKTFIPNTVCDDASDATTAKTNPVRALAQTTLEEPIVNHDESLVSALQAAFSQNAKVNSTFTTTVKDVPPSKDKPLKTILVSPAQDRPVRPRAKIQKHVHFDLNDIEEWLETDYATVHVPSTPNSKDLLEVTLEALRQVETGHDAPERTKKCWENDPKSLTENYLSRVGEWFGPEALKDVKPMGHKLPKASTKSAQRSREMSMEVDTPPNEVGEGMYLGKRKRPDTDKYATVEASALVNNKQDSPDVDTDTQKNDTIETMERNGFSEREIHLIQKLVKGKRAMEPKEVRELDICLADIKRMGEHVNWSGLGIVMWAALKRLSSMEDAPKKLRSRALEIGQFWQGRMG